MTVRDITFYSYDTLVDRLRYTAEREEKRIVFLVGSPASAPIDGNLGVADVDGIIELICQEFGDDPKAGSALKTELEAGVDNPYQTALSFLMGRRGQDSVNRVIREAVVGARTDRNQAIERIRKSGDVEVVAEEIERERTNWCIPRCQQDLASLCVDMPSVFGRVQLTTNFDPLLTLALQKVGGHCYRSVLSRDGSLAQVQGDGCHIVHLHGYWRGVDTLHTPRQLNQHRPKLKASLSELLRNSVLVPVAYSGWDDIFTRTLLEVLADDGARPEILWTYFGDNDADLLAQNAAQLGLFSPGIDSGRLNLYKGVNCHVLFKDLHNALGLNNSGAEGKFATSESDNSPAAQVYQKWTPESISDDKKDLAAQSDAIPSVNDLVGRSQELETLSDLRNKLVAIGGIGGQGKSSLAAYYALNGRKQHNFGFVEWRDCREQNDTLHTVLVKTVQSLILSGELIDTLKEISTEDLAKTLSKHLESTPGLIIFDNVDHYVDLETGSPLGPLKVLIDVLRPSFLQAQLVFTARPLLRFESPNGASIMLKGLIDQDARQLFEQKSCTTISDADFSLLLSITEGHPLWISLIGSRCRHQNVTANHVLQEICSGKGELPDRTLASIWNTLTDKQKTVLRTLAELERPLPEEDVGSIDFELNFNQFTKALRTLKLLGLVELRQQDSGTEVLDLHPLIRRYIRTNFPRPEREKFISRIILAFDRRISAMRELFKTNPPISVLEIWTHKIDLSLNNQQVEPAIDALLEIYSPLYENCLAEEFVRLAIRVFDSIEWATTCATSMKFHKMWAATVKALVELGDFNRADFYIARYAESIEGTGPYFINLCDIRCYRYWFDGDFEQAIFHGERGVSIKTSTNVDTEFDCAYNLALAWRDSGRVDDALKYFLGQSKEEDVLDPEKIDMHRKGAFYGNIGRCYYFKGEIANALTCFKKSGKLLEAARDEVLNRGYIRLWVGQALHRQGHLEDSAVILRAAHEMWNGFTPKRASDTEHELNSLIENNTKLERVLEMPTWRLESRFQQWINN